MYFFKDILGVTCYQYLNSTLTCTNLNGKWRKREGVIIFTIKKLIWVINEFLLR